MGSHTAHHAAVHRSRREHKGSARGDGPCNDDARLRESQRARGRQGAPKRVWETRLERSIQGRQTPEAATPTGVLMFDRAGGALLIGLDDGDIRVVSTSAPDAPRLEHLHRAPIRVLSIDPSGAWVSSADATGEQRLCASLDEAASSTARSNEHEPEGDRR